MRRQSGISAERFAALAGVGALAAWSVPAASAVLAPLATALGIPRRLETGRGIALTFDDGPHPQGTPAVLELLDRAGVRATFYLVGEQVDRSPSLAAEIAAAGHEVAVHGYRHINLLRRSPGALLADYDRAASVIGEATGSELRSYRPPYGIFSLGALRLARERWEPQLWTHWGRDWEVRATPESIARLATRKVGQGDVVLLHDADDYSAVGSWRRTVAALPAVLDALMETGEPLVTVSSRP